MLDCFFLIFLFYKGQPPYCTRIKPSDMKWTSDTHSGELWKKTSEFSRKPPSNSHVYNEALQLNCFHENHANHLTSANGFLFTAWTPLAKQQKNTWFQWFHMVPLGVFQLRVLEILENTGLFSHTPMVSGHSHHAAKRLTWEFSGRLSQLKWTTERIFCWELFNRNWTHNYSKYIKQTCHCYLYI